MFLEFFCWSRNKRTKPLLYFTKTEKSWRLCLTGLNVFSCCKAAQSFFFLPEMLSLKNKIQISERENDIYVNFRLLGKNYDVLAVILSNIWLSFYWNRGQISISLVWCGVVFYRKEWLTRTPPQLCVLGTYSVWQVLFKVLINPFVYHWKFQNLGGFIMVTLNSLLSVCIFSMLFTLQVLWHPQREFV